MLIAFNTARYEETPSTRSDDRCSALRDCLNISLTRIMKLYYKPWSHSCRPKPKRRVYGQSDEGLRREKLKGLPAQRPQGRDSRGRRGRARLSFHRQGPGADHDALAEHLAAERHLPRVKTERANAR